MQPIEKIRKQIDRIDDEILNKLSERLRLAIRLRRFKSKIRDSQREKEVLERVKIKAAALPSLRPEFSTQIFHLIIKESRFIQEKTSIANWKTLNLGKKELKAKIKKEEK